MKVKCNHKQGLDLPEELLALGNTPDSVFQVTLGQDYIVYAMCIWTREVPGAVPWTAVIHYLILADDETHRPNWYPAPLFDIVDGVLPPGWRYAFWGREPNHQVQAIWGYAEIASDKGQHYTALMEREPEALAIFESRRNEMHACYSF